VVVREGTDIDRQRTIIIWRRRMTALRQGVPDEEPIGIVISRGSRAEPPPRVWAYVWGEVSEVDPEPVPGRAA
jgi:hypothetical protein